MIAVAGGGISGLVAARTLRAAGAEVELFEAGTLGGCLRGVGLAEFPLGEAADLGGVRVDVGAEAGIARRPELPALLASLGLEAAYPDHGQSSRVYAGGALHRIPRGIMGVPSDPVQAREILGEDLRETLTPPLNRDTTAGAFVASRLGNRLVERLLDPLLGGVYASDSQLSLRETLPQFWAAATAGESLLDLAAALPAPEAAPRPVFVGLAGGISGVVVELRRELQADGVAIHEQSPLNSLRLEGDTWRLEVGGENAGEVEAEGVVMALPARIAGNLLAAVLPSAGRLAALPHASSAVISVVVDSSGDDLSGSGFLVPPRDVRVIKASTFSSLKWPWLGDQLPAGRAVLRLSVGRYGAAEALELDDEALVSAALEDFRGLTGLRVPLLAAHVQRWRETLPQYLPGHRELVDRVDADAAALPGLALAGNAYSGVGLSACIDRATRAAEDLIARLGAIRPGPSTQHSSRH